MTTLRDKIDVMEAYERGEKIQYHDGTMESEEWCDCNRPVWNWYHGSYRVKASGCGNVQIEPHYEFGTTGYTVTCDCGFNGHTLEQSAAIKWYDKHSKEKAKPYKCISCGGAVYPEHPTAHVCKPPKRLRPWTAAEAIGKVVQRIGNGGRTRCLIVEAQGSSYCWVGAERCQVELKWLLENYEQPDGSPCGVEE